MLNERLFHFINPQHFYFLLRQIFVQCQMVVAVLQKVKALGFNYFHSFLKYVDNSIWPKLNLPQLRPFLGRKVRYVRTYIIDSIFVVQKSRT